MDADRIGEVIRKAKAILPHIREENRRGAATMIAIMEESYKSSRRKIFPALLNWKIG
jgi:hypothetical protein